MTLFLTPIFCGLNYLLILNLRTFTCQYFNTNGGIKQVIKYLLDVIKYMFF